MCTECSLPASAGTAGRGPTQASTFNGTAQHRPPEILLKAAFILDTDVHHYNVWPHHLDYSHVRRLLIRLLGVLGAGGLRVERAAAMRGGGRRRRLHGHHHGVQGVAAAAGMWSGGELRRDGSRHAGGVKGLGLFVRLRQWWGNERRRLQGGAVDGHGLLGEGRRLRHAHHHGRCVRLALWSSHHGGGRAGAITRCLQLFITSPLNSYISCVRQFAMLRTGSGLSGGWLTWAAAAAAAVGLVAAPSAAADLNE